MSWVLQRLAEALQVLREGLPPAPEDALAFVPPENPLATWEGGEARRNAALGLVDDAVFGFVLVEVRREFHGPTAEVRVQAHLEPALWPAVANTLERVAAEARALR